MDDPGSNRPLYTDVVLDLASSFLGDRNKESIQTMIVSIFEDDQINGPGMMPGLVYAGVLHFVWAIGAVSELLGVSMERAFELYKSMYFEAREDISKLPTVNPQFVDIVADFYMSDNQ